MNKQEKELFESNSKRLDKIYEVLMGDKDGLTVGLLRQQASDNEFKEKVAQILDKINLTLERQVILNEKVHNDIEAVKKKIEETTSLFQKQFQDQDTRLKSLEKIAEYIRALSLIRKQTVAWFLGISSVIGFLIVKWQYIIKIIFNK
jgi:ferritin